MCDTTDYHIILQLSHVLVVVQAGGEGEVVRKDAGSKENWGSPKPKKTKEEIETSRERGPSLDQGAAWKLREETAWQEKAVKQPGN